VAATHTITFKQTQPDFVPLALVKQHLKIDHGDEDTYLEGVRDAAIREAEGYLGTFILQRAVKVALDKAVDVVPLEYGPVLDAEAYTVVAKLDGGGTQDLAADFTYLEPYGETEGLYYTGQGYPTLADDPEALTVSYDAGLELAALPGAIRQAILLLAGDLYEYRTDRKAINATRAKDLLRPYRKW